MKKVLLVLCITLLILTGCSKKEEEKPVETPEVTNTDFKPAETQTSEEVKTEEKEPEVSQPAIVTYDGETMQNGNIISAKFSEDARYQVLEESTASWRVTYVDSQSQEYKDGEKFMAPFIQITLDDDDAERLVKSVTELKDENKEKYTLDEIDYNGKHYLRIVSEIGVDMMYIDTDTDTIIFTYDGPIDFEDDQTKQLFDSVKVAQ